jgi:hypothetical protein
MSKLIAIIVGITAVLDASECRPARLPIGGSAVHTATRTTTVTLVIGRRAVCGCGWKGRRRLTRAGAVLDAQLHSARTGCALASPLVWE